MLHVMSTQAYKTDDFYYYLQDTFPGARNTTDLFNDPQVHGGFYNQFESLAINGEGENNLTAVLYNLSDGQKPLFIAISGFSLGGGISELNAVWASYMVSKNKMQHCREKKKSGGVLFLCPDLLCSAPSSSSVSSRIPITANACRPPMQPPSMDCCFVFSGLELR